MEIRPYQLEDEKSILDLFALSFGKRMTLDYWRWRFINNPFTNEIFIDLMWEGDTLIGHYAVSPINMVIDGNVEKTALSMTTMTHPEYGGKGVFSKLADSLYGKLISSDYKMVWGFPNNNSHYGFNKNLGWNDIAIQGMMSLQADRLSHTKNVVEYHYRTEFNNEIVSKLNLSNKNVRIDKTLKYLKWRYFENPSNEYKLLTTSDFKGIVVYKVIPSFSDINCTEIDILDIYYNFDIDILRCLLLIILESEPNIKQFNIWDSLHSENQLNLEKVGFRLSPPITYLGVRNLNGEPSIIRSYENWDISLSYSDVF